MTQANEHYPAPGNSGNGAVSDRMRELLARAAQDYDDDQRTHDLTLDEIRQRLEGVEWALQDVREREVGNLQSRLGALSSQLDELAKLHPPEWAERLAEHMEALREQVKPIAELPSLWADVGVITESVDEALGRIQTIVDAEQEREQQQSQRFDDLCGRVDKLQASIDAAAARFSRVDKALTALDERAARLEQGLEAVSQRTEQGLEGVGSRIEGTSGRLDGIDGRLDGIQGRLDGVDSRVDTVHERLEQLPAALETPELHRRLAELAQRPLPDPTERLASLDERLAEAESHLADVVDRLRQDVRTRPDRQEVEETVSAVVDTAQHRSDQRLSALEESVIALAEALLSRGSTAAVSNAAGTAAGTGAKSSGTQGTQGTQGKPKSPARSRAPARSGESETEARDSSGDTGEPARRGKPDHGGGNTANGIVNSRPAVDAAD